MTLRIVPTPVRSFARGALAAALSVAACSSDSSNPPPNGSGGGSAAPITSPEQGHGEGQPGWDEVTDDAGVTTDPSGSGGEVGGASGQDSPPEDGGSNPAPVEAGSGSEAGAGPSPWPRFSPLGSENCGSGKTLNLGEMRLVNNEWSDKSADTCIFIAQDGTYGWRWKRAAGGTTNPNYPEIEFGTGPWSSGKAVPTTTLLPLQVKDFQSASMTLDVQMAETSGTWNLAFEFWLADKDPRKAASTPKAELMIFLGNNDWWPPTPEGPGPGIGTVINDGERDYVLQHSSDTWSSWKIYRQFRLKSGGGTSFKGKVNLLPFIRYLVDTDHLSSSLWLTRFEMGNETGQNSGGKTTFQSISFEVNGESRTARTAP